jgi:hypothetical protein
MKTITVGSVSLAALAVLTFAPVAQAQNTSSEMLNAVEVRQLAARSNPGDHSRLAAHFAALADKYTKEGLRHATMTHSDGNPSRHPAIGKSPHCQHLSSVNRESAAVARELGAHHLNLAKGAPSTSPRDASRFESGEGARLVTVEELSTLAAEAHSAADHRALEEYFVALADSYTRQADEHVTLAQTYRGTRIAAAAVHQDRLAALARISATEATKAAAEHERLAGLAR